MKYKVFAISMLLVMVLSACGQATTATEVTAPANVNPTATVPLPTGTPAPGGEDDLAAIKASGVLRVGTAGDYPPFSFYNDQNQLDGFDVALAREVATRLGVAADVSNFAFEGLTSALLVKQVDIVFAALSITPQRLEVIDFSSVYYTGKDGILARSDGSINAIASLDQLVGSRIAVQRATVYEQWIRENLVSTGRIPAESLLSYDKVENAIRDLKENRNDLVMLDLRVAEAELSQGGIKLVGQGLYNQSLAAGLRKGSTLTAEVNRVLQEMAADGTMDRLTQQFMDIDYVEVLPTQVPTQPPAQECINAMAYVADLSYDDANMSNPPRLQPGEAFTKGWRIKNTGTCTWDSSYFLGFAYGNVPEALMGGRPISMPGNVAPNQEVDLYVNLVAPQKSGTYQGFWHMFDGASKGFGQTIWVGISVAGSDPTPPPNAPRISYFYFDPSSVKTNQCSYVYWEVKGSIDKITLFNSSGAVAWDGAPAKGSYEVCPNFSGTKEYRIEASGPGGRNSASAFLEVSESQPEAPEITMFRGNPGEVTLPNCALLQWNVNNAANILLYQDGSKILDKQPSSGSYQFCAKKPGEYVFRLVARNSAGVEDDATVTVMVNKGVPEPR